MFIKFRFAFTSSSCDKFKHENISNKNEAKTNVFQHFLIFYGVGTIWYFSLIQLSNREPSFLIHKSIKYDSEWNQNHVQAILRLLWKAVNKNDLNFHESPLVLLLHIFYSLVRSLSPGFMLLWGLSHNLHKIFKKHIQHKCSSVVKMLLYGCCYFSRLLIF